MKKYKAKLDSRDWVVVITAIGAIVFSVASYLLIIWYIRKVLK